MATTKNTKDKGKDKTLPDPNALRVEVRPDDNYSEKLAALATDGALTAITLQAYAGGGKELGVTELLTAMRKAGDETVAGDMRRFERVLTHPFLTLAAMGGRWSPRCPSARGAWVCSRMPLRRPTRHWRSSSEKSPELSGAYATDWAEVGSGTSRWNQERCALSIG